MEGSMKIQDQVRPIGLVRECDLCLWKPYLLETDSSTSQTCTLKMFENHMCFYLLIDL